MQKKHEFQITKFAYDFWVVSERKLSMCHIVPQLLFPYNHVLKQKHINLSCSFACIRDERVFACEIHVVFPWRHQEKNIRRVKEWDTEIENQFLVCVCELSPVMSDTGIRFSGTVELDQIAFQNRLRFHREVHQWEIWRSREGRSTSAFPQNTH